MAKPSSFDEQTLLTFNCAENVYYLTGIKQILRAHVDGDSVLKYNQRKLW